PATGRARHGRAADHARPRCGRRALPPRRHHLRRTDRRDGARGQDLRGAAASLHPRPPAVPAAPEPLRPAPLLYRGSAAGPPPDGRRLPVRATLPPRPRELSPGRARAGRAAAGTLRGLPRGLRVMAPLVEVRGLEKRFTAGGAWLRGRRRVIQAVDGVSFAIERGEVLGLV